MILNVYASNKKASKYLKQNQMKLQRKIDKSTIIIKGLNNPLSIYKKTGKHKINTGVEDLNNTVNQVYLYDIYRVYKSQEISKNPSNRDTFYDHNGIELEIKLNSKSITGKSFENLQLFGNQIPSF